MHTQLVMHSVLNNTNYGKPTCDVIQQDYLDLMDHLVYLDGQVQKVTRVLKVKQESAFQGQRAELAFLVKMACPD